MKILPGDTLIDQLTGSLTTLFRDFTSEQPVDDETFEQILRQFKYDNTPLNDAIDATFDRDQWTIEKVSFDAGYGKERMEAYIYVPKNAKPPFQPIMYLPGSGDIFSTKFNPDGINGALDFLLKSGRVFVYPIYKGTHERHNGLKTNRPEPTVSYKDQLVMWTKDFSRTVDYLETRKDIQGDKIGFLGWSWGGCLGGIIPAVEKRVKAIVLNVGGLVMNEALPEADQINFLPRVTQPVLMLNGKHDMYFPLETSQKPMFNFLGTPAENKKMILYESGHLVPRAEFIRESLAWYDKYLGPVKK
jgi:dienelactone hydrolase